MSESRVSDRFFTWDEFVDNFGAEMRIAVDVYEGMTGNGLQLNCLCKFDFTFVSDRQEKLQRLAELLTDRYSYTVNEIKPVEEQWELNGETGEIPVTEDNLLYWALDMAKRGYELDAKLEAYGAPCNPRDQRFPDLSALTEDAWFEQALGQYQAGNLSGALIGWSHVISLNPRNADAFYSRAIVKNELFTWKSAVRDFDAALEIDPEYFHALINRGSIKADNDDHQGAMADYDRVIRLAGNQDPNTAMAYFNRGNSKLALQDKAGACADWKQAKLWVRTTRGIVSPSIAAPDQPAMHGRQLFAALLLFISSVCAIAAAPPDPIPHLLSGDYAEVERIMQAVQENYKRDVITDEELLVAFRPFYKIDPSQAYHLDQWIERYPKSYVAHVARGVYYKTLGFDRPRYNSKDKKRTAMQAAHDLAARDLYASIELDDEPLLSYFHSMDLADRIGRRPTRLLLRAANAIDPDNFIVRHEFLLSLRPIQGGSMEEMRAYVADSKAILPPEQIRRMESSVMEEEARRALRGRNDPAEAERLYRKVLEFDPENNGAGWHLLYALVNQKKCTEAIALATRLLETPDALANEIYARRGWCNLQENRIDEGVADLQRAAELGDIWAQKELARMYWFGKHVLDDAELARQWLQKAAEQGDDEAQQEMQRNFGVTIDTSLPEKTRQWVKSVLAGAGILAAIVFIVWLQQNDRVADGSAGNRIMRHPSSHLFVGIAAASGFGYVAWMGFWSSYLPLREGEFVMPALFVGLSFYLMVQCLTVRHELLADGALFRRFGGRKVRLEWADVRSIRYVVFPKWFRLESKSGVVVRISGSLLGRRPFARAVLAHAEQAIADDNTREILEEMAEDWAALDSEAPDEAERRQ